MSKIKGIDISSWQGNVDFNAVKNDGVKFIILREGYRKTVDKKFLTYAAQCKKINIPIMVYHFIYTDNATIQQNAQSTYDNIKKAGLNPVTTWIAADLEYDTWTKNGQKCTKEKCTTYTKNYLDALKKLGCKKLFVYTNIEYYKNYFDWTKLTGYPIWLADYKGNPDYKCAIQQYTAEGKVKGISGNVDMDYLFDENMIKTTSSITKVINLKKGSKGAEVKTMQQMLIKIGYSCGKAGADGDFGENTRLALVKFQKDNKLEVDGIYGPKSQTKLVELYNKKINSSSSTPSSQSGVSAQDIIKVMQSWIGLSRSKGTHKPIIDIYNSYTPRARGYKMTYKDAYCDATVSAAFIKLKAVSLIGGTECGVEKHVNIFKKAGIWQENGRITPKPGYIIVYNWNDNTQPNDGQSDHIGIVEKVNGNQIITIEGNIQGGIVARRSLPVGWGYIRGYAKPKYTK